MFDTSAAGHDFNIDNGTFVVDASANRVGIGTTTPSTLLDVNGVLTATSIAGTLTTAAQTNITSVGTLTGLALTGNLDINGNQLILDADADTSFREAADDYIIMKVGGTDLIKIDESGLGIGIRPAEMLDIQSASGDARVKLDAPSGSDTEIKFFNAGSAQYTIGHDDATDNFVIGTANVDAALVSVDKSGNVGIGTTNPGVPLHIASTSQARLALDTTAGNTRRFDLVGDSNGFTVRDQSAAVNRMTITAAGLVGIGKTPAFASLEIEGDKTLANSLQLQLNGATNTNKQMIIGFDTSTDESHIISQIAGSALKPLIVSASAVGIGASTMTPTSALHVDTGHTGSALVTFHQTAGNSSADRGLDVETSSTGTTVQRWLNSGAELARISGTGVFSLYSERLEISNSGDTKATFIRSNNTVSLAMATTASGGYGFYDNSRGGYDLYMKNGTVGIGNNNTSPASTLDVAGGITIDAPANTTPLSIQCATDAYNYATIRNAANNVVGYFGVGSALVVGTSTSDFALRSQSGAFCFSQGGSSERMRIDTSGNLLVGKQSSNLDNAGVEIRGGGEIIITRANDVLHLNRISTDGTLLTFRRGISSTVGSIFVTTSGTSYFTTSDRRLKENIVDAPSASEDIDAIQVRSFDWKSNGLHQKYGMIAQELLSVAPEAVGHPEDSEKMMSIDYSKLVPMLVKEIQSLRTRVTQLEEEK